MVLSAGFLNLAMAVLLVWLAFSPPAFNGKTPDKDPTYLIFVTYFLINSITLLFFNGNKRSIKMFRQIVYSFNLLLVLGAIIFGVASALESVFSGPEIFAALLLLTPPLITVGGGYSQNKHERIYALQGAQNGPQGNMSPAEIYEDAVLEFPAVWPQDPSRNWESLYDGKLPSRERISNLLARHIEAAEVLVLLHSDPGIGLITTKDEATQFIVDHFLKADIQVSDRHYTCFVEISRIGVGTGWRKHA